MSVHLEQKRIPLEFKTSIVLKCCASELLTGSLTGSLVARARNYG